MLTRSTNFWGITARHFAGVVSSDEMEDDVEPSSSESVSYDGDPPQRK